jgi:hypothetical protein
MWQVSSSASYRIDGAARLRSQAKRLPASSPMRSDDNISLAEAVQRIRAVGSRQSRVDQNRDESENPKAVVSDFPERE